MSLLAAADELSASRGKHPCKLAIEARRLEVPPAEIRELFESGHGGNIIHQVLMNHGFDVSNSVVYRKIKSGCNCVWCVENEVFPA